MPSVTDSKHNQKYFIENLKEKLKVIEIAMNIDLKELFSEKGTLSYNTIDCWLKGKTTPQKRKFESFCREIEIDIEIFNEPLSSFKEKISNNFKIDKEKFSDIKSENCEDILALTRSSQSLEEIEEFFREHLVGHWVGVHYWEKFPWEGKEKLCDSDKDKRYLFRHVFHFFQFDKKRKTIRFSFSSARRVEKEWNYQGDVIFSKNKMYFIMETVRKRKTEVALIIANRPVSNAGIYSWYYIGINT